MVNAIEMSNTPEEQELNEKLKELSTLESELAQKELDLATLKAELHALESRYNRIVGTRFAELDRLHAEIAEFMAAKAPEDVNAQSEAQAAREKAEETAKEAGEFTEPRKVEEFVPTKEIRELYRNIAKKVHPDLAIDEKDRERRNEIMAEVNKAYEEGGIERLESILREWETSPEAIEGEDIGSRLIRSIRMSARVRDRIAQIEKEIQLLKETDLFELLLKVDEAKEEGRDPISELATRLDQQIKDTQDQLAEIKESTST